MTKISYNMRQPWNLSLEGKMEFTQSVNKNSKNRILILYSRYFENNSLPI